MKVYVLLAFCTLFLKHSSFCQCEDGICPSQLTYVISEGNIYDVSMGTSCVELNVAWSINGGEEVLGGPSEDFLCDVPGPYLITATFTDMNCSEDDSVVLSIEFMVYQCSLDLAVLDLGDGFFTFTAAGSPEVYPMSWNFGDGSSMEATWVVDHFYEPGEYTICAYVVSVFCKDTVADCISILVPNYDCPNVIEFNDDLSTSGGDCTLSILGLPDGTLVQMDIAGSLIETTVPVSGYIFGGPGDYEVCFWSDSLLSQGCAEVCNVISVQECWSGVHETEGFDWVLYPNPCRKKLSILGKRNQGTWMVEICESTGRSIEKLELVGENPEIDLSGWPSGSYLIRANSGRYQSFMILE